MDEGRRWAIETFGEYGAYIRGRAAELVREEHSALVDAQEASGHRSQGVYGQFWHGILERFEEFDNLSHATLIRPGRAPYRIPVINGVALFAWRWGRARGEEMGSVPFATSDARLAMFELDGVATQGKFEIGMPDAGLSDEEKELAETIEAAMGDSSMTANKVVVVAISSSPMGLHEMSWGEARVTDDGRIAWGFTEDLEDVAAPTPITVVDSSKSFTAGELPKKELRHRSEPDEGSGLPASDDD
ncbi:hypothetical protein Mycsm_01901 [Mycobacterium sp. JS623]|uniref:hypothetical protein n=1 Tax=Mycobacterium sp. JS623 TaxID=212767 RepID=UPI0002A5A567|nr:hypothetical protein [Mycobacterium sp. JS623]AGB22278.1 hypothetical protein Mycsm_01901 [Mycobacterium sp. JS623]